jgi:hypothetical protein
MLLASTVALGLPTSVPGQETGSGKAEDVSIAGASLDAAVAAHSGQSSSAGVRPLDSSIAALLTEGRIRSATFRSLLEQLESSGWIVFVQAGSCQISGVAGCMLHRVGAFDNSPRYLRIVVSETSRTPDEVIATIGHELQHAAEVTGDPRITDAVAIREMYRRIGYVSMRPAGRQLYETEAAIRTGAHILGELKSERRVTQRQRTASR